MATKTIKDTKNTKRRQAKRAKKPQYWFAAKRYGWGWSRALTWQGWLVYAGAVGSVMGYAGWILHQASAGQLSSADNDYIVAGFFVLLAVVVPVLVAICLFKGEPLGWRWRGIRKK